MSIVSIRVDVWELRCRFNHGNYWDRLKANEFDLRVKDRPADPKYGLGPGGLSQQVYYLEKGTGVQIARVHQLLKANGTLGGGGKPDPKELLQGNVRYHLHQGTGQSADLKRDPSLRFTNPTVKSVYMLWRRLKCKLFGK